MLIYTSTLKKPNNNIILNNFLKEIRSGAGKIIFRKAKHLFGSYSLKARKQMFSENKHKILISDLEIRNDYSLI
jgi:hypothetical protein